MQRLRKEKLTMLALGLAGGRPLDKVQLQKAVFLLQQQLPKDILPLNPLERYNFTPYNFGAFCSEVYADAYGLSEQGLATATPDSPREFKLIAAKEHIAHHLSGILDKMPFEIYAQAKGIVEWVLQQDFEELVTEVYTQYPEYKERSVFRRLEAGIKAGINVFTASRYPEIVPDLVKAGYQVRDRLNVQQYLREHTNLVNLLYEAIGQIRARFPEALIRLELFKDPESEDLAEHLFVRIGTALDAQEARTKLRQLQSEWWLARLPNAQGQMTIGIDYL